MDSHSFLLPDVSSDALESGLANGAGLGVRLHLLRHYADIIRLLAGDLLSLRWVRLGFKLWPAMPRRRNTRLGSLGAVSNTGDCP